MQSNLFYQIDSYKKINIIFSLIIIVIFFYCFMVPFLAVTLPSSCEGMPQIYCKSRGLTRSFSEILRFNFDKANFYNSYGLKIFVFFLLQLLARIYICKKVAAENFKQILSLDITLSTIAFIISFYNLIIPI